MSLPFPSPTDELALSGPEHEQMHMFDNGTAGLVVGCVGPQRCHARCELGVRQSRKKGIRPQGQLVREVLPTRRNRVPDKLVGLKAEAGTLKQREYFVAGRQLGLNDRLESAKEACLRIEAVACGVANDQASLSPQHATAFASRARSVGEVMQRHRHEDEVG